MDTTHTKQTDMTPALNLLSLTVFLISLIFRGVAQVTLGNVYNVLAVCSVLMIIVINYPKFRDRVRDIFYNKPKRKRRNSQ